MSFHQLYMFPEKQFDTPSIWYVNDFELIFLNPFESCAGWGMCNVPYTHSHLKTRMMYVAVSAVAPVFVQLCIKVGIVSIKLHLMWSGLLIEYYSVCNGTSLIKFIEGFSKCPGFSYMFVNTNLSYDKSTDV